MKESTRIFFLRPWFLVLIGVGILGGTSFEWLWRTRVENGDQSFALVTWVKGNSALREHVGEVNSANVERSQSFFTLSFGGGSSGCYHYLLNTLNGPAEIWLTWHQDSRDRPVVADKLEIRVGNERKEIWPTRTGAKK